VAVAIITKISVTPIKDETTETMVSVTIAQTLIVETTDPIQSKTETLVSSRAIRPYNKTCSTANNDPSIAKNQTSE
jgi:hypothetical protein